jgi:hypothetical protein
MEITPLVWRRLLVPQTLTLPTLHRVLQTTLGWTNFVIGGVRYSGPDPEWANELPHVDHRVTRRTREKGYVIHSL